VERLSHPLNIFSVDLVTNCLSMTEHLFISSSYVHFILTHLKCHGSLTSQALEIIFEVQRKRSDKKISTRKISFPIYKTRFFLLLLLLMFGALLLSNLITFLFIIHLRWFKMLQECHKSSLNSNSNKATYKEFFKFQNKKCITQHSNCIHFDEHRKTKFKLTRKYWHW